MVYEVVIFIIFKSFWYEYFLGFCDVELGLIILLGVGNFLVLKR